MKKNRLTIIKLLSFVIVLCFSQSILSQNVGINAIGSAPDNSALLDVDAIGMNPKKGLLVPRMTIVERNAIVAPANSLFIFNTTTNCFEAYISGAWYSVSCPLTCITPATPGSITGYTCVNVNQVGIVYSISSVTGASTYLWSIPVGATITSGQGSTSITVTFGTTSGTISVVAGNSCGTSSASTLSTSLSRLSCRAILTANPGSPDGVYTIDPDGAGPLPCMPCQCDMTTDGGGWTLIANYSVPNNVTAADVVLTTFPLINNISAPLGTDERSLPSPFYGRIDGTNLANFPFTDIRVDGWRGPSTTPTTIANFKFSGASAVNIIRTNGVFTAEPASAIALVGNNVVINLFNSACCSIWAMREHYFAWGSVAAHNYLFWAGYLTVDDPTNSVNVNATTTSGNKRLRYWLR